MLRTDDIKLVVNIKANLKCQWQLWFGGKKHSNCEFGISFDKSWGETCNIELDFFYADEFQQTYFLNIHISKSVWIKCDWTRQSTAQMIP